MSIRSRSLRLGAMLAALVLAATTGGASVLAHSAQSANAQLDHVFVIMLENHSKDNVLGADNYTPFINSLASTYGVAANYYGVTHPSEPNYVAAISGSNWFINDDSPNNRFDHTNLVDQLEASHHSWAAYMDSMPSAGFLGDQYPPDPDPSTHTQLYVTKHNPFVLFDDVRNNPARLAQIKPYSDFAGDLASGKVADFVWISPNQCHDMHGGIKVAVAVDGSDGTPCPYGNADNDANDVSLKQKADAFVQGAVEAIMSSKAWTGNSAIFLVADENDFQFSNFPVNDGWESAAWCCDSPILPDGYKFSDGPTWHGQPGPNGTTDYHYGGGLVPAIVVATHGVRGYVSDKPYNHYSLLRTIEENWHLGYLGNASDSAQVHSMNEFLVH